MKKSSEVKMSKSVARDISNMRGELKIRRAAEFFLSNFEVFHLVMKHCVECLISITSQTRFFI